MHKTKVNLKICFLMRQKKMDAHLEPVTTKYRNTVQCNFLQSKSDQCSILINSATPHLICKISNMATGEKSPNNYCIGTHTLGAADVK